MPVPIKNLVLLLLMLLTAGAALVMHPTLKLADTRPPIAFDTMVPKAFGDWQEMLNASAQIIDPQQKQSLALLYSQTVSRTYVNRQGYRIMLSLAYGKTQRSDLQLHHPELCYPAQGFELLSNRAGHMPTPYGDIPVRRLETRFNQSRVEPVTYWALVGDQVVLGSVPRKLVEMRYGLRGQIADGLLFRVSSIDKNSADAFDLQARFVSDLLAALSLDDRRLLAGL